MRRVWITLVIAALATSPTSALACATCFGDPESPLTKGALMGVYVLVGVVGFVLAGIAATGLFWIQRSKRPRTELRDRFARPGDWDSTDPR